MWCGGGRSAPSGPSLERLGCCKYPRRWLWLCGFWVSDDSSLRWHRSDAIKGFFRPQFALAWSMRLDMRLFHTVARLHSFVRRCFGLWWKNILPLMKLRRIRMSETNHTYLMWCVHDVGEMWFCLFSTAHKSTDFFPVYLGSLNIQMIWDRICCIIIFQMQLWMYAVEGDP